MEKIKIFINEKRKQTGSQPHLHAFTSLRKEQTLRTAGTSSARREMGGDKAGKSTRTALPPETELCLLNLITKYMWPPDSMTLDFPFTVTFCKSACASIGNHACTVWEAEGLLLGRDRMSLGSERDGR